jgi:hypothetical protein
VAEALAAVAEQVAQTLAAAAEQVAQTLVAVEPVSVPYCRGLRRQDFFSFF